MGNNSSRNEDTDDRITNIVNYIRDQDLYKDVYHKEFNYENLVLEGGGIKGVAFCGMALALSDLGFLKKIKRFAGASVGAVTATYLAIGLTPEELIEFYLKADKIVQDSSQLALIWNVITKFGWFKGDNAMSHVEKYLLEKTGSSKTTFQQLYESRGVELCIAVTNVSTMQVEYCHPKTTPSMSISTAIRMTTSIPPIVQPYTSNCKNDPNKVIYYSDGGLLANYPLQVFDGWFLSMDADKSFLHMLDAKDEPFGKINEKTLGCTLFSIAEFDSVKLHFFHNWKHDWPEMPNTKVAQSRYQSVKQQRQELVEKGHFSESARQFIIELQKADKNGDGRINIEELGELISDEERISDEDLKLLFNASRNDAQEILEMLDINNDGEISFDEILWYLQKNGISLLGASLTPSVVTTEIKSVFTYLGTIFEAIQAVQRSVRKVDVQRTMGLYCDYIQTADLELTWEDKQYGMKLGWLSALRFLEQEKH